MANVLGGDPGYLPGAREWLMAILVSTWIAIPAAMQGLLVLMVLDYCTGLICAAMSGRLSAIEGFRGLARKTMTLVLVATAWFVGRRMQLGVDLGSTVAMAFAANEAISIVVNCARAGVPIPESLMAVMVKAKRAAGHTMSAAQVERGLAGAGKRETK